MIKHHKTQALHDALPAPVEKLVQAQVAEEIYGEPVVEAVLPQKNTATNQQTNNTVSATNIQQNANGNSNTQNVKNGKAITDSTENQQIKTPKQLENVEVADKGQLKHLKAKKKEKTHEQQVAKVEIPSSEHQILSSTVTEKEDIKQKAKELEKKGVETAIQQDAQKQVTDTQKMNELVSTAGRPLMQVSSTFPFDIFPDRLTIEETRVNIIFRTFFATEQIRSITLKDIMEVQVQTALFFATLKIVSRTFNPTNDIPLEIKYLRRSDAERARHLIEGLKVAVQENIDTTRLDVGELIEKAEELGRIHELK